MTVASHHYIGCCELEDGREGLLVIFVRLVSLRMEEGLLAVGYIFRLRKLSSLDNEQTIHVMPWLSPTITDNR